MKEGIELWKIIVMFSIPFYLAAFVINHYLERYSNALKERLRQEKLRHFKMQKLIRQKAVIIELINQTDLNEEVDKKVDGFLNELGLQVEEDQ